MPTFRRVAAVASRLACASLLLACDRPARESAADSASAPRPAPAPVTLPGTGASDASAWNEEAGPALVVATDSGRGIVVLPTYTDSTLSDTTTFDLARIRGARLELFSRREDAGPASLHLLPGHAVAEAGCTSWPAARVTPLDGSHAATWTIGLAAGRAHAIPLEPLADLGGADSAKLAAEIARVASSLPDNAGSIFRGLPFSVRDAWRMQAAPGTDALVAGVLRRINQEANPRVEHLLLVAERDSGDSRGRFRVAYFERTDGLEETLEMSDVLAAVSLGTPPRATIVLARDYGDGAAYSLLERTGARSWRIRWSSAYTGC